jgi:hypothetical protein
MPSHIETAKSQPVRLEIRHQIPGRIRLHLPGLQDDPRLSRRLMQALEQVEGVRGVRWNPACASLVVWHRRAGRLTQAELSEILDPVLQPVVSYRPTWIEAAKAAPAARPATRTARTSSTQMVPARTPATWTPNWRVWLARVDAWRLRPNVEVQSAATAAPNQPNCRLCQLKLSLARWIFNDLWRCWTHEVTTPQRPQTR